MTLTFNLPEQIFQIALLLLKENNCAKLFQNPHINVEIIVRTTSIYEHFISWHSSATLTFGGGRVVRRCWVNFQCRGVLQFGFSRARAYCACSRCGWGLFGHFYSHLSFLSSFSLSLGDGPIWTEILSQRAVKPKTNQPTTNIDL